MPRNTTATERPPLDGDRGVTALLALIAEQDTARTGREEVHCPEHDQTIYKDSVDAALETAKEHDETLHDGERVTLVNGMLPPRLDDEDAATIREGVQALTGDSGGETGDAPTTTRHERPDGWPAQYSAAGSLDACPHQMHWDDSAGVYRCVNGCGVISERPPESH